VEENTDMDDEIKKYYMYFEQLRTMEELDLEKRSEKSLVAILLDLSMYKHDTLVNSAFTLAVRHFSQSQYFLKALKSVQLLE